MPTEVTSLCLEHTVVQQTVEKKLADLPTLPSVVAKIIETANNPNTTADEMQRLIGMDQGLTSKILRIVNSAYYGFPKRVSTIAQAVMILGFGTVRNLVLGVSAFGMLGTKSMPYGLERLRFWQHCAATAVTANLLSKRRLPHNYNAAEQSFLGGLLHDIGALFLDGYFPVQYAVAMAYASRESKSSCEAESTILSMDHAWVGRRIAEHWNFPPPMTAMLGRHHCPHATQEHFEMIALVHAADWLVWQAGYPSSKHAQPPSLDAEVSDWFAFTDKDWEQIQQALHEQFAQCEQLIQAVSS
jgi:HD-like signal output (HDOD) protein